MKRTTLFFSVIGIVIILTLSGCASSGMFTAGNMTEVQLQRNNFKIVALGVTGEAEAEYLFGTSMSIGMVTNTFSLIRIGGTGMLYKEALDNLWKNYEAAHGPVEGKKLALINVRYDSDVLNLFVYTKPKVMIRADVIEFTD